MKRLIPHLVLLVLATGVQSWISNPASAATITATSCSQTAVQSAITSAATGDTVVIPAGTCAWTTGISITKGIILTGASKGAVTLIHDAGARAMFAVTPSPSFNLRISNLRLIQGTGGANYFEGMFITVNAGGRAVLIHDNYFETKNDERRMIKVNGNRGVIYSNEFYSNRTNSNAIKFVGPDSSWLTADTMGMRDTTGESNVYVEDNYFRQIPLQVVDADDNSRVVLRYNTFDNSGGGTHGADSSPDGTRHWEVYNNTYIYTDDGKCVGSSNLNVAYNFYIRGGTGIIADNVIPNMNSCAYSDKPEIWMSVQNIRRNAGPYPCWGTYPVPHQVGQGHNGTSNITDPVYIWGNTGGGNYNNPGLEDYTPDECGANRDVRDFIQAGRDYILGVKPGYQKYTYPHPLRTATAPLLALSVSDATVAEGGTANFTLSLSAPSSQTVTVLASTANGTAAAGSDYTARSNVTVTFPPGNTTQTFGVNTLTDAANEANETFFVNLSGAINATITDAQGLGTITNAAPPPVQPSISISSVTVAEGSTATFTVSLSAPSTQTVTVLASTSDGTATAGADYTARSNITITFPAGSTTQSLPVTTITDAVIETTETFFVNLASATNATISGAQGTGTITNVAAPGVCP